MSCLIEFIARMSPLDSNYKAVQDASDQVYDSVRDISSGGDVAHVSFVIDKRERLRKLPSNSVHEVCQGHRVVSPFHSIEFLKFGLEKLFTRKT